MKKLLLALTLVLCLAVSMVALTSCGGGSDCEHIWATEATVDTAATCTQEGVESIKCTVCGEKKADSITAIPAYGHSYDEGTTVPATCTEDGSVTKTCAVCGDVNVTTIPAAGEHTWSTEPIIDTYPTCTTDGQKSIKCTACQVTKPDSTEVIPAGHTWAESAAVIVPATCTTEGSKAIKCTVCREVKPDSTEVIPATGHTDIDVVVVPTLFTEGRIKGTCSTCGIAVNEVVAKADPTVITFTPDTNKGTFDAHTFESILNGDHFYPTTEDPDGKALYIEYSMLWTEEFVNASVGKDYMLLGRFDSAADNQDSNYDIAYALSIGANDGWTDPATPGYFDVLAKDGAPVYGPDMSDKTNLSTYPSIGGYGWHRIGIVVKQIDGARLNATLYIDGVKVSSHNISPRNTANLLYTEENGEYKDIDLDRVVRAYYFGESNSDANAYFAIADLYVTAGDGFVMPVTKLDTPTDGTYSPAEDVTLDADQYFAYEKSVNEMLYDETLESVEYPVDMITPADGTVDFSVTTGGTKYHRYQAHDNKRVAFIKIKDIAFNTVNIGVADGATVRYTFFSKMPTEYNEVVSYAIQYRTFIDATADVSVEIPANAEYLVLYYQDNATTKYIPESLTFTNNPNTFSEQLKDNTLETLEYPINELKPSQGTIASANLRYIPNFDWVATFIDIRDCAFEQVTIEVNAETGTFYYAFLTQFPDIYDYPEFAGEGNPPAGPDEGQPVGTTYTYDIPEDAVCLYIYWQDEGPIYYIPESITFTNTNAEPPVDENLLDETLTEYEYPMDEVVGQDGAIIYWGTGEAKNAYLTEADGKAVGFYKNAFINITDTTFNYVTLVANGTKKAGWAFISEMPEVGEKVDYVGNFAALNKFAWTVDTNGTAKIEIPEGAKYLVLYYEEAGNSYLPASITFTKEEAVDTDNAYEYPIDDVVPFEGYINHSDSATANSGKYHYLRYKENNESHAFIDITDLDYNTVTISGPANGEATNYAFLSKMPTEDSEKISYATGYSDMIWFGMGNGDLTVTIPADAVCLVVLHHYSNGTVTMPESIVFSNRETVPAEMLKNDTLDSYEYPMTEINASMGTIASSNNKFIRNYRWVTALVPIEGCVFDKVVFEIDETYGKISYGFLTDYPTADAVVSWAGGATGTTTANIADGATVTVDIPDDAKVLVIYWHDWDETNNVPVYYIPESVTFIKAEDAGDITPPAGGDSEDAENAGTTTPGGSTDSEDSENAGTTTPTNPGFGTATDSEDSEDAGTTTPIFGTNTRQ